MVSSHRGRLTSRSSCRPKRSGKYCLSNQQGTKTDRMPGLLLQLDEVLFHHSPQWKDLNNPPFQAIDKGSTPIAWPNKEYPEMESLLVSLVVYTSTRGDPLPSTISPGLTETLSIMPGQSGLTDWRGIHRTVVENDEPTKQSTCPDKGPKSGLKAAQAWVHTRLLI